MFDRTELLLFKQNWNFNLNYLDIVQPIENFANPEITPAADMRKDRDYGDGAHLDQKDWDITQSGFVKDKLSNPNSTSTLVGAWLNNG